MMFLNAVSFCNLFVLRLKVLLRTQQRIRRVRQNVLPVQKGVFVNAFFEAFNSKQITLEL